MSRELEMRTKELDDKTRELEVSDIALMQSSGNYASLWFHNHSQHFLCRLCVQVCTRQKIN